MLSEITTMQCAKLLANSKLAEEEKNAFFKVLSSLPQKQASYIVEYLLSTPEQLPVFWDVVKKKQELFKGVGSMEIIIQEEMKAFAV